MPCYKPTNATFSPAVANFPVATTAPGSTSVWGGPPGKPPVQLKWIPAQRAKR